MGGHIDCHLDISSLYSFLAFKYLLKNREKLASHGVSIEFHPIFLGGVNVGSGNKPPWTLPVKAKYLEYDGRRAKKYHGLEDITTPSFFPPLTILPQRALCYIKANFSTATFEKTWMALFESMWIGHNNVTVPEVLTETLTQTELFTAEEIDSIMSAAKDKIWKDKLTENTQKVLDQGAFGAPWMMVANDQGAVEPFFGSDRFHFMWEYLQIPWNDIEIIPKANSKAKL